MGLVVLIALVCVGFIIASKKKDETASFNLKITMWYCIAGAIITFIVLCFGGG